MPAEGAAAAAAAVDVPEMFHLLAAGGGDAPVEPALLR